MSFKTVLKTCFRAAKRAAHWLSEVLTPQATTKRWLLVPAVILLGLAGAYLNVVAQSGAGFWVDALTGAILAILLGLVVALLLLVTRWLLQRAGRHLGVLPVAAVLTAAWLLHIIGSKLGYLVALTVFVGSYLVVTGVLLLIKRQRLIAATAAVLLGAWLSLGMLSWLIIEQPGSSPVAEQMVAFSGGDAHQRQAAKAYFTAFVEQGADPVFCAPEQLGTVLPVDIFVARCQLSERYVLADFEQGMDVTNGNTDGVHMKAQSLALWKEAKLPFRQGHRERAGVWLGWNAETEDATESFYLLELPPGVSALQALNQQSVLHLELAQLDQDPPEYENISDGLREAADFMIVLEDRSGNSAQVRLSEVGGIAPPLPAAHIRDEAVLGLAKLQSLFSDFFASHKTTEAVIQSVQMPLELFSAAGVQLDDLSSVRLHFDQGASVIIIDEISVRE